jgi:hypothetical protein
LQKWELKDQSFKEVAFTMPKSSETEAKPTTTAEPTAANEPAASPTAGENIETAQTVIDATDNVALATFEAGFNAANKIKPASSFANGAKVVSGASKLLGAAGIGLTIADAATDPNGWQTKHTIDAAIGVASFAPGVGQVVAISWFVGNLISQGVSGKSLSENIQQSW